MVDVRSAKVVHQESVERHGLLIMITQLAHFVDFFALTATLV